MIQCITQAAIHVYYLLLRLPGGFWSYQNVIGTAQWEVDNNYWLRWGYDVKALINSAVLNNIYEV